MKLFQAHHFQSPIWRHVSAGQTFRDDLPRRHYVAAQESGQLNLRYFLVLAGMDRDGEPFEARDASNSDMLELLKEAGLSANRIEDLKAFGIIA